MLKFNVTDPITTQWTASILLAPKKFGALRFCVDYRRLNVTIARDACPISLIEECTASLATSNNFSTRDCNFGYRKLLVWYSDWSKTILSSQCTMYYINYPRCHSLYSKAPESFQRAIAITFSSFSFKCVMVCLYNNIVFPKNAEEHLDKIKTVLPLL